MPLKHPYRIVIQARTTSSRLPAKVLLPIGGMPLAVLVARRVARNGADVVLATSTLPEDDLLAHTVEGAGLAVIRGPIDDVFERFLIATADLADTDICVRLTADNPVPDADFVEQIVALLRQSGKQYIAYGNDGLWLPYGLSAEAFYVSALRQAQKEPLTAYDREHVTPWIRRRYADYVRPAFPNWTSDLGHLRCTVDELPDYLKAEKLFRDLPNSIQADWRDLVRELEKVPGGKHPTVAFVLGTAQLGMPYGRTNKTGFSDESEAQSLLEEAANGGVVAIDTARAYGESERRIGNFLHKSGSDGAQTVTKLDPLSFLKPLDDAATVERKVLESVESSQRSLGLECLPVLLLHRADHLTAFNGTIWRTLLCLQAEGKIAALGVSVQNPNELRHALNYTEVKHIQLPFNILDWRWDSLVVGLRLRPDVTVHVRSVFLQGLLVQETDEDWPEIEGVNGGAILATLRKSRIEFGRESLQDLCVAYVRGMSWIDGAVLGVDTKEQLAHLRSLWTLPALSQQEANLLKSSLPRVPERLLNPALWPLRGTSRM
jgi:spore coat polysaccharide biosynthesis protein SpsF (cytidylyltransferase family)/aryl-alcohol dehydrogenase-like predicted oxidoreductase